MRLGEFGGNVRQIGLAHASPGRIAGLRHEAVDHAVEDDAVVELALHKRLDLLDVLGREIGAQLDDDLAVLCVEVDDIGRIAGGQRAE